MSILRSRAGCPAIALVALLVLLGSGCAPRHAVIRQIPIDKDFTAQVTNWSGPSGRDDAASIRLVKAVNSNGRLEVCGAQRVGRGVGFAFENQINSNTQVVVNGKVVLTDINFFGNLPGSSKGSGGKANCVDTGVAAPKGPLKTELRYVGPDRFYSS